MTQSQSPSPSRLEDSFQLDPKTRNRRDGEWGSSKLFQKEEIPPLARALINPHRRPLQRCEKGMDVKEEMELFSNVYKR